MKVASEKFVSIDYELKIDGEVVDKSEPGAPLGFVSGVGNVVEGLDDAIQGKEAGDRFDVSVSPDKGYGAIREDLIMDLPRENFPEDLALEVGMVFEAETPHGFIKFKVVELKDEVVIVDLNHPLAGKELNFSVAIAEVRDATEDELNPSCDGSHECHHCHR